MTPTPARSTQPWEAQAHSRTDRRHRKLRGIRLGLVSGYGHLSRFVGGGGEYFDLPSAPIVLLRSSSMRMIQAVSLIAECACGPVCGMRGITSVGSVGASRSESSAISSDAGGSTGTARSVISATGELPCGSEPCGLPLCDIHHRELIEVRETYTKTDVL
jgi:hypothetical protein